MSKKFHIVINPSSASGNTLDKWEKVRKILDERKVSYQTHFSTPNNSIEDICTSLTSNLVEEVNLVLIGGDGSVNEAINGLVDIEKVNLGFIPCGSGNDLAKDLNIPKDIHVIEDILKGEVKRLVDIGQVRLNDKDITRRFIISSGSGFDAEICVGVNKSNIKTILNTLRIGKLSYLLEAMRIIFSNKSYKCEIKLDEDNYVIDKCKLAVAMNHRYEGGGFMFCPNAVNNDGVLALCIAKDLSTLDFFRFFRMCYDGSHVKKKDIVILSSSKVIKMKMDQEVYIHTDGEVVGTSKDVEFNTLPIQLKLLI